MSAWRKALIGSLGLSFAPPVGAMVSDVSSICEADLGDVEVVAIAADDDANCAVFEDGAAQCWGRLRETLATSGVVGAALTSSSVCFVYDDGAVRCSGAGSFGALGSGSTNDAYVLPAERRPVSLSGRATAIAAGQDRYCVLLEDDRVQCWGEGGELGYGNFENIGDDEDPSDVGPIDVGGAVIQVVMGSYHTCVLLRDGSVKCWGGSKAGQLGLGNQATIGDDETLASVATLSLGESPVVQLAAGSLHTCARHEGGELTCWGDGDFGQLGYPRHVTPIGDDELPSTMGHVEIGGSTIDVAAGLYHTCAILEDGTVRCWGRGYEGQLGNGSVGPIGDDEAPALSPVVGLSYPAIALAAGSNHTCAILTTGRVQCWGLDDVSQLGCARLR